jgi:AcrR family transcriptional regulator
LRLEKEGEDALTVNRIAEVSGAAVGSIYQYFPNKESMIAAVYERLLDQESEQLSRCASSCRACRSKPYCARSLRT